MAHNRRNLAVLTALAATCWLAGCTEVRHEAFVSTDQASPDAQVSETVDPACTGCHGSDGSSAPPLDLRGRSADTSRGVGAHAAHLANNTLGSDIACESCHKVPATVDAPGHTDTAGPAEVIFAGTAVVDGAAPTLEAGQGADATVTCSSVYCHGATLAGGALTAPAWNPPNPAASKCDACHGFPPPEPHPAFDRCDHCHAPVVSPEGTIADRSLHVNGTVDVLMFSECDACHGSDDNPAPPIDLKGQNNTTAPGVGAHQSHLMAAHGLASPVACTQCHKVPASVDAPGHLDDGTVGADLTFGALATGSGDVTPAYDGDTHTCSNTYCHGATLPEGAITAPVWTQVDDTQAACGACHGVPPPDPHPQSHECGQCHPATAVGMSIAHPEKHIDGTLDVAGGLACNGCHGSEQSYAPPVDTKGGAETTLVTVGAHQPHLLASSGLASPVACTECHEVPGSVDAEGHLGESPAEVRFGTLATAGAVVPVFDRTSATCSATYCHGATLPGGSIAAPVWTQVDDTQDACGSCHGVPPPAPHVQLLTCGVCHAETAEGMAITHPEKHIDGVLQVGTALACSTCHGNADNPAPPLDTHGDSETTLVTVGAHQSHVTAKGGLSAPLHCTDCHVQPAAVSDAGHLDAAPAEIEFGALASAAGALPAWDPTEGTCSSTYCHGATLPGGVLTTPVWTVVDGSQEACGACHGVPPPAPHVQLTSCGVCHAATAVGATIAHPEKHINGQVEVDLDLACSTCHGSADNPAPPVDTTGGSETTLLTVGAHQPHLAASSGLSAPLACTDCHVQPATVGQLGHLGAAPAEVEFGALASAHGATPEWDRANATCSSTYCHGATLPGGSNPDPTWTLVDNTEDACGSCHGVPPPEPHVQLAACGTCHTATAVGATIAHPEKHIDGTLQVNTSLGCNTCHGNADNPAPPVDTNGGSSTTLVTVGAHQAHVAALAGLAAPIDCDQCHVTPASMGDAGHLGAPPAEIAFGALASAAGTSPAWDRTSATCSSTYCHGTTLEGGTAKSPVWTTVDGTQKTCDACHGNPPPAPHAQMANCGSCHPATAEGGAIAHPEKHVDGTVDVDLNQGCNACHGNATNAAPPVDTNGGSATTLKTVGAHQAHLQALSALASPVGCTTCHVVPSTVAAAGHLDSAPAEVAMTGLAASGGATPAWSNAAGTCSSTYCHGATLNAGGAATTPLWTKVDGTQDACGACHGNPPPAPHVQMTNCGLCHPATAAGGAIAHPEKHIDGTLDVDLDQACNACHGNATNSAPPVDTNGGSATTLKTVGAHQAHLTASSGLSSPVACATCHVVPAAVGAAGHLGLAPAEVTMTGLAAANGATPAWSSAAATCSSTYCHGATLDADGTITTPLWTKVDNTQDACGTCHGNPPSAPHVQNANCGLCHTATASGGAIAHPEKHIDGTLDVDPTLACNACHGNATNAAPPVDTNGASATTLKTVGAHQAHLTASSGLASPVACTTCHVVPATVDAAGHLGTAPAEVTMTGLAAAGGANPAWNAAAGTCSSTYCHGATLNADGTTTIPLWTKVDNTQDTCGACHGNPPSLPHAQNTNCGLCHSATATGGSISHAGKHIDGTLDVDQNQACNACHGSVVNDAPPVDTNGNSATTLKTVGAHQAHLQALSSLSSPVACSTCHSVPGAVSTPDHLDASPAEVTMTGLADDHGATPTWNAAAGTCSSTYCHGATLNAGGTVTSPLWTKVDNTQDACGTCHGNPPPAPHVSMTNCGLCHPSTATGGAIAHPEKHIDGTVDVQLASACNACHGGAGSNAPPVDTTGGSATTLKTVGAHQAHLTASSVLSSPVACTECHVVPATTTANGHLDAAPAELTFGTLANTGAANGVWNAAAGTCSSTYCHGATLNSGSNKTPLWTKVDNTQDACGTCHGRPNTGQHVDHHGGINCRECHNTVATTTAITGPALHINGAVDISLRQGGTWNSAAKSCDPACHGNEDWL